MVHLAGTKRITTHLSRLCSRLTCVMTTWHFNECQVQGRRTHVFRNITGVTISGHEEGRHQVVQVSKLVHNRQRRRRYEVNLNSHLIGNAYLNPIRHNNHVRGTFNNRINVTTCHTRPEVIFSHHASLDTSRALGGNSTVLNIANHVRSRVAVRHTGQDVQNAVTRRHTRRQYRVSVCTDDDWLQAPHTYQLARYIDKRYTLLGNAKRYIRANADRVLCLAALLVSNSSRAVTNQHVSLRLHNHNLSHVSTNVPVTGRGNQTGILINSY